jgi:hypothetical protein
MHRSSLHKLLLWVMVLLLGVASSAIAQGAPADAPKAKVTAEQQAQLERLAQLDEQLQKSRAALHAAINQYGWDSDEAEAAREKVDADRAEYRKLRRSLRAAGVAVPPPTGFGARAPQDGPRPRAGRGYGRHSGCRHHGPCNCPCAGW